MKFLFALMVVLTLVFFAPPILKKFNSQEIHGSTDKRVLESVKDVRRNLQTQQRHVFDVAFGLLKEFKSGEGENAFAKTVGVNARYRRKDDRECACRHQSRR